MFDTRDGQHLARLLLISKMRNLANDVSPRSICFNGQDIWSDNNSTFNHTSFLYSRFSAVNIFAHACDEFPLPGVKILSLRH
jgi:hypothetical protein